MRTLTEEPNVTVPPDPHPRFTETLERARSLYEWGRAERTNLAPRSAGEWAEWRALSRGETASWSLGYTEVDRARAWAARDRLRGALAGPGVAGRGDAQVQGNPHRVLWPVSLPS